MNREISVPLLSSTQLLAFNKDVILGVTLSYDHDAKHNKSPEKHKGIGPVIDEQLNQ